MEQARTGVAVLCSGGSCCWPEAGVAGGEARSGITLLLRAFPASEDACGHA